MDSATYYFILRALDEDIGPGDVTTRATVDTGRRCHARLVAKQDGVLSGIEVFLTVFEALEAEVEGWTGKFDGDPFSNGETIAEFSGDAQTVLTGERTALNFVQRLSGVATLTAKYVEAVAGTGAKIVDMRKTTPMMRALQKRAVLDGGGANHRIGLYDGVLIKNNHIAAAGSITEAVARAREETHHLLKIEVEVATLEQCQEAVAAGADVVMLDNMDLKTIVKAVALAKKAGLLVEASGNMTLERVREVAETGVDLISVGALTHSAPACDMSLRIQAE